MSKHSQLLLVSVIGLAIPALTGLGVGWWVLGPETSNWLHGLLPRLLPLGAISVLVALPVCFIELRYHPELRDAGAQKKGYIWEVLLADLFLIALFLMLDYATDGWPGMMTDPKGLLTSMGVLVTIGVGMGVGMGLVCVASLLGDVIHPAPKR